MSYIVYTEHHFDGKVERWYYGTFKNRDRATEVASELCNAYPYYHFVCKWEEASGLGVQNLPY